MTDAIAWALVHFLWQGTALALIAALLMRLTSAASARYLIGVATLTAMVITVGMTASLTILAPTDATELARRSLGEGGSMVQSSITNDSLRREPLAPWTPGPVPRQNGLPTVWILTLWLIGVTALSVRALGGWWVARRVARDAIVPLSGELQAVARAIAQRLCVRRAIGVFESSRVSVPVMIGWLRPVVLMPPAAVAGLSIAQVEAIFAHEFAHIRRHDYVVNLLQTAVETVLFFHPAVWWISREIRRERELCCDDLAVSVSDRLTYATALSALAHLHAPSLALAATDGSLRDRVRRIITNSPSSESAKGGWMAMLPLLLVVSLAVPSAFTPTAAIAPQAPAVILPQLAQPTPRDAAGEGSVVITANKGWVQLKTPNGVVEAERIEIQFGTDPDEVPKALTPLSDFAVPAHIQAMELQAPPVQPVHERRIAAGDILRLSWMNIAEPDRDMNQRYVVAADGSITLKYIGAAPVAGKTEAEIERMLVGRMTEIKIYPAGVIRSQPRSHQTTDATSPCRDRWLAQGKSGSSPTT